MIDYFLNSSADASRHLEIFHLLSFSHMVYELWNIKKIVGSHSDFSKVPLKLLFSQIDVVGFFI